MQVKMWPKTEFVVIYLHLKPTEVSLKRVGGFLVFWDRVQARYIYFLTTKEKFANIAK